VSKTQSNVYQINFVLHNTINLHLISNVVLAPQPIGQVLKKIQYIIKMNAGAKR